MTSPDTGLCPTIENLAPHDASDWPATYDDEAFRAKKKSGAFAYQTKQFPQWLIPRFADTLREELKDNNVNWAEDFFFIHMIRGTKHEEDLFNLAATGHRLPPSVVDDGFDVDEIQEPQTTIDAEVSQMWRQFLIDMQERLSVSDGFYQNDKLSDAWRACQWKIGNVQAWKRAFDHLFPPPGHETLPKVQNYTSCRYYLKWKEICLEAENSVAKAIQSVWLAEQLAFVDEDLADGNMLAQSRIRGTNIFNAIELPGITAKQFASLLWVIYNPHYGSHQANTRTWKDINTAAKALKMAQILTLSEHKIKINLRLDQQEEEQQKQELAEYFKNNKIKDDL
ncbi:hypothetical protein BYT27DRAFT_7257387 [Phlegmacium glaucopus]|nr:hypothetical protein BYT27DRAFT_7257387 [Phlegmacium glaucopus]